MMRMVRSIMENYYTDTAAEVLVQLADKRSTVGTVAISRRYLSSFCLDMDSVGSDQTAPLKTLV